MNLGISLSYQYGASYIYNTVDAANITSYSHTLSSYGGYDSQSFSMSLKKSDLHIWLYDAIGRKVKAYSRFTGMTWEGIINEINISYGSVQITIGPFLEVANRVLVKYTEFSTGVPGITTYRNDTVSQNMYGTLTKVLNGGSVSATNAGKIADSYLLENAYPKTTQNINNTGDGILTVNVSCVGKYRLLETYTYNSNNGTQTVSTKIKNVLEYNPGNYFSTSYSNFYNNTLSVSDIETEYRTASDVIKDLIPFGDGTSNNYRTTFGVYRDGIVEYRVISETDYRYIYDIRSNLYKERHNGAIINASEILPGYYIKILGISNSSLSLRRDPTMMFIESVSFTAPNSASISGGKFGTLSQQLAKLGISGL